MKRRNFLVSSLAASAVAGVTAEAAARNAAPATSDREFYELRRYQLRRGPQQQLVDAFFRDAAIPTLNRMGVKPLGVFSSAIGPGSPTIYALFPHASIESAVMIHDRAAADPEFQKAGAAFINAPAAEPAFVRLDSYLLRAFAGMPKLELPPGAAENQPRIFELRIYESHSKKANRTKMAMFNDAEIAVFRRTGLRPVFFGETLIGSGTPSLIYMLTFANMEERMRNWAAFVNDPEWKKLAATPGYTDPEIVSNVSNFILSPMPYSQI
jgi:hypothetical protein